MLKKSSVTIKDIANRLGVSTSTVSRAMTGSSEISTKTKEAVLELVSELDYQPNTIAQSLKIQQTHIIGIIIPETVNRFFSKAIGGIQDLLNKSGYNILACQSNESFQVEKANVEVLINTRVDGLIVSVARETKNYDHFKRLEDKGIPTVFFDRIVDEIESPKVFSDNFEAAFKATKHLVDVGCKRIARISGPQHLYNCRWRLKGYLEALEQGKLDVDEDLIIYTHYHAKDVADYTRTLLDMHNPPDGIFAINDEGALQMMKVIRERGLRIPEDIAIIGFNNDFYGDYIDPSLSTVEIPAYDMGRIAAELLLNSIKMEDVLAEKRIVPSKLIIRDSTKRFR